MFELCCHLGIANIFHLCSIFHEGNKNGSPCLPREVGLDLREVAKRMQLGRYQRWPVAEQEATETQEILPEPQETLLYFTLWATEHWHREAPSLVVDSPPRRSSKAPWTRSWTTCFKWYCLSSSLDQMTSRGFLQPQSLCGSVDCVNPGVRAACCY